MDTSPGIIFITPVASDNIHTSSLSPKIVNTDKARNIKKATAKKRTSPIALSEPHTIKKTGSATLDSRLLNKYAIDSKPPFIVHIENLSSPSSLSNPQVQNLSSSDNLGHKKGGNNFKKSESGTYGIIAFGKRISNYIDLFKCTFDLESSGKNKFSVSFSDGNSANKFCDLLNNVVLADSRLIEARYTTALHLQTASPPHTSE